MSRARTDDLGAADLVELAHMLPETAHELVRTIGAEPALALMNRWPGVAVSVPKFADKRPGGARRWAQMVEIIGEPAMHRLAQAMGGTKLEIPLMARARLESRFRSIRADFQRLTARTPTSPGLSKAEAMQEIVLLYAPITGRQVRTVIDRPDVLPAKPTAFKRPL